MDVSAEWLEADGQGGFASGTVGLLRTRRYHALLLASATPPTGRFVLVNGIEAWAVTPAGRTALTAQAYADGTVFPDGRAHLRDFQAMPFPSWSFALPDGTAITFALFCARDDAETVLRWTADRPIDLLARPLFSGRDYHALHHQNDVFAFGSVATATGRTWHPYRGLRRSRRAAISAGPRSPSGIAASPTPRSGSAGSTTARISRALACSHGRPCARPHLPCVPAARLGRRACGR